MGKKSLRRSTAAVAAATATALALACHVTSIAAKKNAFPKGMLNRSNFCRYLMEKQINFMFYT